MKKKPKLKTGKEWDETIEEFVMEDYSNQWDDEAWNTEKISKAEYLFRLLKCKFNFDR